MQASDLTFEVRDVNLNRMGLIRSQELAFSMTVPHNNVATWKLELPYEHPMSAHLQTPGSGLIVMRGTETIMSGPTTKPTYLATASDPGGTVYFEGVNDTIVLADMLAWPEPSNPEVDEQTVQYDTRSGPSETLMHQFVNANIGPSAASVRRKTALTMGTDLGRGSVTTKSARFEVLGELLSALALPADLGFQVIQRGDGLVFETYAIEDRTSDIRLDVQNNTLSAQKVMVAAPDLTRVIVVGEGTTVGEEKVRSLTGYHNAASEAAEVAWGRRIERIHNLTQTNDAAELQQAANERLADKGFTAVAVEVVPMEGDTMQLGTDWNKGDRVTVVVNDFEYVSVVTGYALRIDSSGFYLSATLGDPTEFDAQATLRRQVQKTGARLSALERNG